MRIDCLVGEGDQVVAFVTPGGTNTGEWMGQPATGNKVAFTVVHLLRFSGGRIIEDRQFVDRLAVFEQFGVAGDPQRV